MRVVPIPVLSIAQARCLHLAAQGLLTPPRRRARPADLVAAVEQMRLLQIDTIHVVARSPYLVLHARLGDYPPDWLDQALASGRLAECWAHEACFVPAADVGWHMAWRSSRGGHWAYRRAQRLHREHRQEMDALLATVERAGAMRAADFESARPAGAGWWSWKPEKSWLEAWFALGHLMVARRERFQRVYAPVASVLVALQPPLDADAAATDAAGVRQRFILDSVGALGVTQARWIADYYRLAPAVTAAELAPLLTSGELLEVAVTGWPAPGYVHRDHAALLAQACAGRLRATHTALLSPFDPLVWDRARALAMFGFDYSLECYVPAPRRVHGYFVLPILQRGALIGRLDAKAHRSEGVFEIKTLSLEADVACTTRRVTDLAKAIAGSARWHGTPQVKLGRCRPAALAAPLRAALRQHAP